MAAQRTHTERDVFLITRPEFRLQTLVALCGPSSAHHGQGTPRREQRRLLLMAVGLNTDGHDMDMRYAFFSYAYAFLLMRKV